MHLRAIATSSGRKRSRDIARARSGGWTKPELIADAKAEQDRRYQTDAWDARIDRWLAFERRRVNHGYGNYDDWRDEEIERASPLTDVSVGEILEGALGIEPARWTKADQMRVGAYLKRGNGRDIRPERAEFREWRYKLSPERSK